MADEPVLIDAAPHGLRHGLLAVVAGAPRGRSRAVRWYAECECGWQTAIHFAEEHARDAHRKHVRAELEPPPPPPIAA